MAEKQYAKFTGGRIDIRFNEHEISDESHTDSHFIFLPEINRLQSKI